MSDNDEKSRTVLPEPPVFQPNLPPVKLKKADNGSDMRQMGLAWAIPISLVSPIIVMTLIGVKCDAMWHKSPTWTLTGVIVGTIAGFTNMMKIVRRLDK